MGTDHVNNLEAGKKTMEKGIRTHSGEFTGTRCKLPS